jgi:hypothetical protein
VESIPSGCAGKRETDFYTHKCDTKLKPARQRAFGLEFAARQRQTCPKKLVDIHIICSIATSFQNCSIYHS